MIPSARVLADILNDPAIPAEAKGEYGHTQEWVGGSFGLSTPFGSDFESPERVNAALFWSLSAFLWDVGSKTMGVWRAADLGFMASTQCDKRAWAETPTEALADVVRYMATASAPAALPASADTPGSPPGA